MIQVGDKKWFGFVDKYFRLDKKVKVRLETKFSIFTADEYATEKMELRNIISLENMEDDYDNQREKELDFEDTCHDRSESTNYSRLAGDEWAC